MMPVRWSVGLLFVILSACGCQWLTQDSSQRECCAKGFRVDNVRLQRSFTRISEHGGDQDKAAGIEAFVELRDQFGDPIKAVGTFRFEIFQYRPAFNDPRGKRFVIDGIQAFDLTDPQRNYDRWNKTALSYSFDLKLPQLPPNLTKIVLQVTFTSDSGYRLQDRVILNR